MRITRRSGASNTHRRVRAIEIKGLFGLYHHYVPLQDSHITIVHGPNGVGKTALLRLVEAVFDARTTKQAYTGLQYQAFRKLVDTPFETLTLYFRNDTNLTVRPEEDIINSNTKRKKLNFTFVSSDGISQSCALVVYLRLIEPIRLVDIAKKETIGDAIERQTAAEFLTGVLPSTTAWLVLTDRLMGEEPDVEIDDEGRQYQTTQQVSEANRCAQSLETQMRNTTREYSKLAQELDKTYPRRVLQGSTTVKVEGVSDVDTLRQRLNALTERRNSLKDVGLLAGADEEPVTVPTSLDNSLSRALALYVQDMEEKLSVFDDLARRIKAFQDILQGRFLNKRMIVNPDDGFHFITDIGTTLKPEQLSSGEQHQIVLFHWLLFRVRPGNLLLMDEPELSLHAEWQSRFVEDLKRVVDITPMDIVLATHSPLIVAEHVDWMVALKGLSPEQVATLNRQEVTRPEVEDNGYEEG